MYVLTWLFCQDFFSWHFNVMYAGKPVTMLLCCNLSLYKVHMYRKKFLVSKSFIGLNSFVANMYLLTATVEILKELR